MKDAAAILMATAGAVGLYLGVEYASLCLIVGVLMMV